MRKCIRVIAVLSVVVMLLFAFMMTGCSRHPNEEQLRQLEETKQAAMANEDQQAACANEKAELEKQLAESKQKLEKMKQEKESVNDRLSAM
jgi:septal ring factor EnvC (AmiA/AmiB activator)